MTRGCLGLVLLLAALMPCVAAVEFDGNDDYRTTGGSAVQGNTHSVAVRFLVTNSTTGQVFYCAASSSTGDSYLNVSVSNGNFNNQIGGAVVSVAGVANNTWHTGVVVNATAASHACYLDGSSNTGTTDSSMSDLSFEWTCIGAQRRFGAGPSAYLTGNVAWVAVWSVALDASQSVSITSGASPFSVAPGSLTAFYLLEVHDPAGARNLLGNFTLGTVTSDPATVEVPPRPRHEVQQSLRFPDLFDEEVLRARAA